jgi:hypothetical protein
MNENMLRKRLVGLNGRIPGEKGEHDDAQSQPKFHVSHAGPPLVIVPTRGLLNLMKMLYSPKGFAWRGGQETVPYEQKTQQSPDLGRRIVWHFWHSYITRQESTGIDSVL